MAHKILHGLDKRAFFRPSRIRGGGHKLSLNTTNFSIRIIFSQVLRTSEIETLTR